MNKSVVRFISFNFLASCDFFMTKWVLHPIGKFVAVKSPKRKNMVVLVFRVMTSIFSKIVLGHSKKIIINGS